MARNLPFVAQLPEVNQLIDEQFYKKNKDQIKYTYVQLNLWLTTLKSNELQNGLLKITKYNLY